MSHKKFLAHLSASNFYVVAMNFREKEKGFWRIKKKSSKNLILLLFNRKENTNYQDTLRIFFKH